MNKRFGFGSKRKSTNHVVPTSHSPPPAAQGSTGGITPSPPPLPPPPPPTAGSVSTASLPMNPNQLGRPPSYTYAQGSGSLGPNGQPAGRSSSPLPPPGHGMGHPPPSQAMNGPPPLNTGASTRYPTHGDMGGMGAPPPVAGGPPQYGGYGPSGGVPAGQYAPRPDAVEVEGAGRSKAQLIVGIDFVSMPDVGSKECGLLEWDRALLFPVSLSLSQRTTKQKRISSPNGQGPVIRPSKR